MDNKLWIKDDNRFKNAAANSELNIFSLQFC